MERCDTLCITVLNEGIRPRADEARLTSTTVSNSQSNFLSAQTAVVHGLWLDGRVCGVTPDEWRVENVRSSTRTNWQEEGEEQTQVQTGPLGLTQGKVEHGCNVQVAPLVARQGIYVVTDPSPTGFYERIPITFQARPADHAEIDGVRGPLNVIDVELVLIGLGVSSQIGIFDASLA